MSTKFGDPSEGKSQTVKDQAAKLGIPVTEIKSPRAWDQVKFHDHEAWNREFDALIEKLEPSGGRRNIVTKEELARIRTFALRGHEADGSMYPGGGLRALQQLLEYVDELLAGKNFDLSEVDDGTVESDDRFMLWAKYRVPHVWEKLVERKKLEEADEEKARV